MTKAAARQSTGKPRPAGIDDGHFGIKLVNDDFEQIYVPSRVATGTQVISLTNNADDNFYELDGGDTYTVSDTLPGIDTRFSDYALSDINRVLVHHALIKGGYAGQQVNIVTGLPVEDYYFGNQQNEDFISRKEANLLKSGIKNRNSAIECAQIAAHSVVSEGIAAFFDLLLNKDGTVNRELQDIIKTGAVGMLDIGGKTTDTAVIINGGKGVDAARSGTSRIGALSLNTALENRIKHDLKIDSITPMQVERAAVTGMLRAFGTEHDVSALVNEEKAVLAKQIIAEAKRKMRDAADLECVYFVGGGSLLMKDQLQGLYPHARFVEDPQFANARGMLKIAKFIKG